jgi:hypothetical protein
VGRQVYLWIVVELVYKNQTGRVVPAQSVIINLGIDIASGLKPTIYRTLCDHVYQYTTNVVIFNI